MLGHLGTFAGLGQEAGDREVGLLHRLAHFWHLTPEKFDAFNFGGILLYKMGIWMFFIIPCIALYIIH